MAGDSLLRVRGRLRRGRLGAGLRAPFGAARPLPVRFGSRLVFLGGGQNTVVLFGGGAQGHLWTCV